MDKLLSEHIALTPIQAFLESESWGFYRGVSSENNLNCCINADYAEGKDKEGGFLTEDALSADMLMSMAFIEPTFISELLKKCGWDDDTKRDKYEVVGVQSNFWYPHFTLLDLQKGDKEENHLRLAQPDGWITGDNLLVMIEAKGMRDGAAFNYAQLAKEYLIAKQECDFRRISQPRILLLLTDEQITKIDKKGGLVELFDKSWKELRAEKQVSNKWSETKVKFFNGDEVKKNLDKIKPQNDAIEACFKILSYKKLEEYAKTYNTENSSSQKLAAMIANTIAWHTNKSGSIPIWSRMLMDLAAAQTPLYEFYTGGTINKIVTDAEDEFFKLTAVPKDNPIRKAVENVRKKILQQGETIKKFYRLYCIQKYWQLQRENAKSAKSDTVKYNYQYFTRKYNEGETKLDVQECRKQLKEALDELDRIFEHRYGDQTGIVSSGTPNVRYLLYSFARSLINIFSDEIPGYEYFAFDNKKFFRQK